MYFSHFWRKLERPLFIVMSFKCCSFPEEEYVFYLQMSPCSTVTLILWHSDRHSGGGSRSQVFRPEIWACHDGLVTLSSWKMSTLLWYGFSTYTHARAHTHTNTRARTHTHKRHHTHTHTHTYIYIYIYIYIYTRTYTYTQTDRQTHTHKHRAMLPENY